MTEPAHDRRATDHLPIGSEDGHDEYRLPFPWVFATPRTIRKLVNFALALQRQNVSLQAEVILLHDRLNRITQHQPPAEPGSGGAPGS